MSAGTSRVVRLSVKAQRFSGSVICGTSRLARALKNGGLALDDLFLHPIVDPDRELATVGVVEGRPQVVHRGLSACGSLVVPRNEIVIRDVSNGAKVLLGVVVDANPLPDDAADLIRARHQEHDRAY